MRLGSSAIIIITFIIKELLKVVYYVYIYFDVGGVYLYLSSLLFESVLWVWCVFVYFGCIIGSSVFGVYRAV